LRLKVIKEAISREGAKKNGFYFYIDPVNSARDAPPVIIPASKDT
jgi:hypothetical protein